MEKHNIFQIFHLTVLLVLISSITNKVQSASLQYTARLQPELDVIDVDRYLSNERLFNLQMNCIIFDGACDSVGRWLKPRIPYALLGQCYKCTTKQETNMNKILEFVLEKRPDLYRAAVAKYLENSDIDISEAEKANVRKLEEDFQKNS